MRLEQWLGKDNKLGMDIWTKKYQQNNESFDQWLDRVSGGNEAIKNLIIDKKFLFGGRILSNRGMEKQGHKVTYSNCYVIDPPEDSIESIFEAASKLARTFSYGGGCGLDISKLSPRGAKVNNTARKTTGSVSFMELYSMITGLIGQNGRRGALMLSLDCNHPDIEEFISIKNDLNSVTKANISVKVTDDFMKAVIYEEYYDLTFVRPETNEEIVKRVFAPDIFRKLCENNWNYAEPGILYWDVIQNYNLLQYDNNFEYAGVNPCAEEPLPAGGSCLLGSLNLAAFVGEDEWGPKFEYGDFEDAVELAVVALNEVLDEGLPLHPLEEQRKSVADWRQIGLGIFGLADMLIQLGYKYGSRDAKIICHKIARTMATAALRASAQLAAAFGAYPKFNKGAVMASEFFNEHFDDETWKLVDTFGLRNSQLLTIAPTGSLSTMLGVSGGIEPIFDTHYVRKTESLHGEDVYYTVYTPIVERYMKAHGINDVKDLPDFFVTAKTLDGIDRVEMQAAWQEHIDASISSTVNLPESATVEDVMQLYLYAWKMGLKGLTIFRENCARLAILTSGDKKEEVYDELEEQVQPQFDHIVPVSREELGGRLNGTTYVKEIACGKLYITINRDENDNLVEVFIDPGKSGGCTANAECIGRYASACMRAGMSIDAIIDVTKGVKCSACMQAKGMKKKIDGLSCGDVVAKTIQEEYGRYHGKGLDILPKMNKKKKEEKHVDKKSKCPECGGEINNSGGCIICPSCGYSKCD